MGRENNSTTSLVVASPYFLNYAGISKWFPVVVSIATKFSEKALQDKTQTYFSELITLIKLSRNLKDFRIVKGKIQVNLNGLNRMRTLKIIDGKKFY